MGRGERFGAKRERLSRLEVESNVGWAWLAGLACLVAVAVDVALHVAAAGGCGTAF